MNNEDFSRWFGRLNHLFGGKKSVHFLGQRRIFLTLPCVSIFRFLVIVDVEHHGPVERTELVEFVFFDRHVTTAQERHVVGLLENNLIRRFPTDGCQGQDGKDSHNESNFLHAFILGKTNLLVTCKPDFCTFVVKWKNQIVWIVRVLGVLREVAVHVFAAHCTLAVVGAEGFPLVINTAQLWLHGLNQGPKTEGNALWPKPHLRHWR